jgi:hypothetical protein
MYICSLQKSWKFQKYEGCSGNVKDVTQSSRSAKGVLKLQKIWCGTSSTCVAVRMWSEISRYAILVGYMLDSDKITTNHHKTYIIVRSEGDKLCVLLRAMHAQLQESPMKCHWNRCGDEGQKTSSNEIIALNDLADCCNIIRSLWRQFNQIRSTFRNSVYHCLRMRSWHVGLMARTLT